MVSLLHISAQLTVFIFPAAVWACIAFCGWPASLLHRNFLHRNFKHFQL